MKLVNAGAANVANMPAMATATNNSINVNPSRRR
jgi:hypothetical protein